MCCGCSHLGRVEWRERNVSEQAGQWHFLTNHARALFAIARDPAARLRDIAAVCHITERTAQSIVTGLEQAGCIHRDRVGRRTRGILCADGALRHPAEAHVPLREHAGRLHLARRRALTSAVSADGRRWWWEDWVRAEGDRAALGGGRHRRCSSGRSP
ncbi:MarR family transcriptional regulator [Streptomyces griseofuscus]|uniref:MarR family transcriptional regulator n=2 Tax=Streptomyces TaxID=1883 RepID=UPI0037B28BA4